MVVNMFNEFNNDETFQMMLKELPESYLYVRDYLEEKGVCEEYEFELDFLFLKYLDYLRDRKVSQKLERVFLKVIEPFYYEGKEYPLYVELLHDYINIEIYSLGLAKDCNTKLIKSKFYEERRFLVDLFNQMSNRSYKKDQFVSILKDRNIKFFKRF